MGLKYQKNKIKYDIIGTTLKLGLILNFMLSLSIIEHLKYKTIICVNRLKNDYF
jgi:hypothetical protein